MITIDAALVREQGVTFAVVVARPHVLNMTTERDRLARQCATITATSLVVLMSQDSNGRPTFWGRRDIVNFLANVPFQVLPWKRYHLN